MAITIDKKTGILVGTIAVLALGIVFLLAGNSGAPMDHSGHGSTSEEKSSRQYSADEIMFAQMMIPHHEQAVTMSELALSNTTTAEIVALATAIRDAQAPEIIQMQSWIDGKSESHMHDMEMGGMLSDAELAELAALKGAAFDQMFLTAMIAHHEGALDMVEMINDSSNSEVKTLAANIVTSQSAEIEAMKALLK
ncbi:hypothetical protein GM51_4725 [freshwater metagenome]|jgi:uncharacterized protein (DUF305 family)|uniref:DUF305 domain-containing protein n=1 Tax=freshwater metagenome TaxID=449393 RepID=A0A094Q9R0_9ZZZZ